MKSSTLFKVYIIKTDVSERFFNGSSELCWDFDLYSWDEWPTLSIDLQQSDANSIRIDLPPEIYMRLVPSSSSIFEKCYRFGIL